MIITSNAIIIKCLYEKLEASLYQNTKLEYFIAKVLDGDVMWKLSALPELAIYIKLLFHEECWMTKKIVNCFWDIVRDIFYFSYTFICELFMLFITSDNCRKQSYALLKPSLI